MVRKALVLVLAALPLAGCGASGSSAAPSSKGSRSAHWSVFVHSSRPVDLAGPRRDGKLVLAAAGRLRLLRPDGKTEPFAPAYKSPGGEEPYIALAPRGCFGADTVYALKLAAPHGVLAIDPAGHVRSFVTLPGGGLANGIAFDSAGRFAHRLLVTVSGKSGTTVYAISCAGGVEVVARGVPHVEGGIAVAPRTFGRFGGALIAPDELSGRIYAITPNGRTALLVNSRLAHGGDIGVESEGFIPSTKRYTALLSDRLTPGNKHPGDDVLLALGSSTLRAAGVRPGDLLVATEGGSLTDAVSCSSRGCQVREVAVGPTVAHAEGHIAFLRG